jgi:hypothetical protein
VEHLQLRDGICVRSRPHDQAGETSEQRRRARECRGPLAAAAGVEGTNVAPVQLGRTMRVLLQPPAAGTCTLGVCHTRSSASGADKAAPYAVGWRTADPERRLEMTDAPVLQQRCCKMLYARPIGSQQVSAVTSEPSF